MTELERIQLLLSKKFGCDVAMAVYMAVMCYRPTENDSLEYGMRAMHAWRQLYIENVPVSQQVNDCQIDNDQLDDYDSCLE